MQFLLLEHGKFEGKAQGFIHVNILYQENFFRHYLSRTDCSVLLDSDIVLRGWYHISLVWIVNL
jgi:hypothetical protein